MIYTGDKSGRIASFKLIFDNDQLKSTTLINDYKGCTSQILALSVTFDH